MQRGWGGAFLGKADTHSLTRNMLVQCQPCRGKKGKMTSRHTHTTVRTVLVVVCFRCSPAHIHTRSLPFLHFPFLSASPLYPNRLEHLLLHCHAHPIRLHRYIDTDGYALISTQTCPLDTFPVHCRQSNKPKQT